MKTKLFLICISFFFATSALFAVNNTVATANKTEKLNQKQTTQTLEFKKTETKASSKLKAIQLYKKIKNIADDTMLILLVLLALLLPPLAVFLKDGKKATTLFWITLILCLLGGGFWWGWFFGGFYAIAILLALLRVFDVL